MQSTPAAISATTHLGSRDRRTPLRSRVRHSSSPGLAQIVADRNRYTAAVRERWVGYGRVRKLPSAETPTGQEGHGRALIRTLPLWRGNYGGVLQAYALQRVLTDLGWSADVDISERLPWPRGFRRIALDTGSRLASRPLGYRQRMLSENVEVAQFVATEIATVRLFIGDMVANRALLEQYDAIVCGSDQIWRSDYGDVGSYLLDFVPEGWLATRVAYAASFGVERPPSDLSVFRAYAQRFAAVSVREAAGVVAASELWGVEAEHVVDPTMLLPTSLYEGLIEQGVDSMTTSNSLVVYVLDDSPGLRALVDESARRLGLEVSRAGVARRQRAPNEGPVRPGVEDWLAHIAESRAVLTDSFHGCVFALMFNKPFAAIGNARRGMARFVSLLDTFGLRENLVELDESDVAVAAARVEEVLVAPVVWERVNSLIGAERTRGREFLTRALGSLDPRAN